MGPQLEGGERHSERCWSRTTQSSSIITMESLPLKEMKNEGILLGVHFLKTSNNLPKRNVSPRNENNLSASPHLNTQPFPVQLF